MREESSNWPFSPVSTSTMLVFGRLVPWRFYERDNRYVSVNPRD